MDITYFKSSLDCHLLDLLWNMYWVNTLSSSPLLGNGDYVAGQISDLGNHFSHCDVSNFIIFLIILMSLVMIINYCTEEINLHEWISVYYLIYYLAFM